MLCSLTIDYLNSNSVATTFVFTATAFLYDFNWFRNRDGIVSCGFFSKSWKLYTATEALLFLLRHDLSDRDQPPYSDRFWSFCCQLHKMTACAVMAFKWCYYTTVQRRAFVVATKSPVDLPLHGVQAHPFPCNTTSLPTSKNNFER